MTSLSITDGRRAALLAFIGLASCARSELEGWPGTNDFGGGTGGAPMFGGGAALTGGKQGFSAAGVGAVGGASGTVAVNGEAGRTPSGACHFGFAGDDCTLSHVEALAVPEQCVLPYDSMFAANDLSGDGNVVVGACAVVNEGAFGFRWTAAGGFELLSPAGSEPMRTNQDGSVAAGFVSADVSFVAPALRWVRGSSEGQALTMGAGRASDVSGDGKVIVGAADGVAFRFSDATGLEQLGTLVPGGTSFANATNGDGSVVVGDASLGDDSRAFWWTSATGMRELDLPNSAARRVSADGSVVVGDYLPPGAPVRRVFRWTSASGFTEFGSDGVELEVVDIDRTGTLILAEGLLPAKPVATTSTATFGPLLWDSEHGLRPLMPLLAENGADFSSYGGFFPAALSDDGKLVAGTTSVPGKTLTLVIGLP
jgi:hypothetical protein